MWFFVVHASVGGRRTPAGTTAIDERKGIDQNGSHGSTR
jgi:hypothetical protein